ncbi:MAG TPA: A24 family peptidase [Bryobacteraceae bacterium]|nr:A24 family peptidase [Bryobacteraceae bacterium]
MTAQVWIAVVVGVAASIEDLVHRQISNWISVSALLAGLVLHVVTEGWRGGLTALLGSAAGFGVFLIFYIFGGMGGGDVKLMAGFGAVLGFKRLLAAALWTAACGGVFAAAVIAFSGLRGLWRSYRAVRNESADGGGSTGSKRPVQSIPYAPAIAAGVWLSLVPKG